MVITDPIADLLTRLRNAGKARHEVVEVSSSKMKERLAHLLKKEGYISDVEVLPGTPNKKLRMTVRYRRPGEPMIAMIKRVSKPGCRFYVSKDEMMSWKNTIATTIISTSKGVMTHRQAIEANIGGEVICRVE